MTPFHGENTVKLVSFFTQYLYFAGIRVEGVLFRENNTRFANYLVADITIATSAGIEDIDEIYNDVFDYYSSDDSFKEIYLAPGAIVFLLVAGADDDK